MCAATKKGGRLVGAGRHRAPPRLKSSFPSPCSLPWSRFERFEGRRLRSFAPHTLPSLGRASEHKLSAHKKNSTPFFPSFSNTNNDFFHSFQVNTSKALARGAAEGGGPGAALVCAAFGLSPPPPPCAADKRKKSPLQLVELSPPFFFPRPLCVNNTPGRGDRAKKRCASTSFGKKMCPHFFTRRQQHNPFSLSLTHHDTQIHLITSAACT